MPMVGCSGMSESTITIKSYRDKIEGKLTDNLEKAMKNVGLLVANDAKRNIVQNQAKSPWRKTGQVSSSVIYQVINEGNVITAEIGIPAGKESNGTSVDKVGKYLELGTVNHPPYPWLMPAVESNRQRIIDILKGSGTKGATIE